MKRNLDINWLFYKYYNDNPELRRIVVTHSEQVAHKALQIRIKKHLPISPKDIYCAAILHDIGVVKCFAPDIHAHGSLHYLNHGLEGMKMLNHHGLKQYASVCSTHTGAGITAKEIIDNNLPLPPIDLIPKTLLEKLICYADKFFSKSGHLEKEKSLEEVLQQIKKFGPDALKRFIEMHKLFSPEPIPDGFET